MNSQKTIFESARSGMSDILGPLVDVQTPTKADDYCVIRAIIPPGAGVPLHSHADRETMVVLAGRLAVWLDGGWRDYNPGELVEVPPNAKHALRNGGESDVAVLLVTTARMGRFFQEIGEPIHSIKGPPSPERIAGFVERAISFGYWLGDENDQAKIGRP
jgi:quercetin dioxygenase-like cupin family protein